MQIGDKVKTDYGEGEIVLTQEQYIKTNGKEYGNARYDFLVRVGNVSGAFYNEEGNAGGEATCRFFYKKEMRLLQSKNTFEIY